MSKPGTNVRAEARLRRGDAGFSLVSVVVALVLLSVGVLSLSNVMTQSVTMQTIASTRTSALYIAQTHMEEVRSRDPLTLASEAVIQVDEEGNADINGVFSRELTVTDIGGNLLEVVVIVTSPRSNPIRLVTWIYDGAF